MDCKFEYCIYNRDSKCIADEQEIDSIGMCGTCIVVSINKHFVEEEKEKQLLELEKRWCENTKE